jgi:5'-nucleotidase
MGRNRKLVMVTNDDGVQSDGIIRLAKAVNRYADVIIVAPEQPQSATAMSLTFHKPLRVSRTDIDGIECYAVSGSPADCVMIGVNKLLQRRPELVASGINVGDNDTYQDILASGTVAAAMAGALAGIPAIAFSMEAPEDTIFSQEHGRLDFGNASTVAAEIVKDVLENGMPKGAEVLNVNFPSSVSPETDIEVTGVARRKYKDKVLVRKDPRNRPYYWLFGERLGSFPPNTDADAIYSKRKISISPLALKMSVPITKELQDMKERVQRRLRERERD